MPDNPSAQTAATYNSTYGLGQFFGGSGGAANHGGDWTFGTYDGVFTLNFDSAPTGLNSLYGFRCVYRP